MDESLLTGDISGLGLISVYSHALFFGLCTRAVVLLLLIVRSALCDGNAMRSFEFSCVLASSISIEKNCSYLTGCCHI